MNDFEPFTELKHAWVFLVFALWGGLAHHVSKVRQSHITFSVAELFGDLCISGFSGMLAYALARHLAFGDWETAAVVGISGHMGSRTVFILERWLRNKFQAGLG